MALEEKLALKSRSFLVEAKIIAADLPARDFSRERAWLAQHRVEYDGQWVALDGDKLVAALAHGAAQARRKVFARHRHIARPIEQSQSARTSLDVDRKRVCAPRPSRLIANLPRCAR